MVVLWPAAPGLNRAQGRFRIGRGRRDAPVALAPPPGNAWSFAAERAAKAAARLAQKRLQPG